MGWTCAECRYSRQTETGEKTLCDLKCECFPTNAFEIPACKEYMPVGKTLGETLKRGIFHE